MKNFTIIITIASFLLILSCDKNIVGPENGCDVTINVFNHCRPINDYNIFIDSTLILRDSGSNQTVIRDLGFGGHKLIIEATDYLKFITTFSLDTTLTINATLIRKFDFQNLFKLGNKWIYDALSEQQPDLLYVVKEVMDSLSSGIRMVEVKWIYRDSIYSTEEYWLNYKDFYLVLPNYGQVNIDSTSCFYVFSFYNPTDSIPANCSYYNRFERGCGEYMNLEMPIQKKYYKFHHQVIDELDTTFISPEFGMVYDKYYKSDIEYMPIKEASWILQLKGAIINNNTFGDTTIINMNSKSHQ